MKLTLTALAVAAATTTTVGSAAAAQQTYGQFLLAGQPPQQRPPTSLNQLASKFQQRQSLLPTTGADRLLVATTLLQNQLNSDITAPLVPQLLANNSNSSFPTIDSLIDQLHREDQATPLAAHLESQETAAKGLPHHSHQHHHLSGEYGAKSLLPKTKHQQEEEEAKFESQMMITKSPEGYYVFNNITLKSCRDVLKPSNVDRCALTDYIDDCVSDEGLIDYVAFFFCAFSQDKMPLALLISILWLLTLFVATGVTATDFLCPALFMISKTLGLSQNIAGVTFLAFGNTSADIFAAINGIRLGSGTLITTAIVGCVFAIKDFRLDRLIFVRDIVFYGAAVTLLFYIFTVPGRIRLRDSVALLGLYALYVIVVLASKYFTKDRPLKNLHGPAKKDPDEGGIEFEGVYLDDDPTASMVVMRRFLFYSEDSPQLQPSHKKMPSFRLEKGLNNGDTVSSNGGLNIDDTVTTNITNKSSRRVTLFEENLFTGVNNLSPDALNAQRAQRSRSASIMSISKQQLGNLRRASRDIRRQSMDFLAAVSPIDPNIWKQRNWGGKTMELIKAPIRLFLLITTPMADVEGKHEWNKLLSTLHCITGPIFVVYSFGYGFEWWGPLPVPVWVFLVSAPISLVIIFTSTSETPPFYYNAYSSYLGFIVAITWIYTISSEVINLLRAMGIAFNLSNEIMGLTILAWGNCMLDLITNISIARRGLPKMAIAACYGGPLMSTLVGIGLPSFITLVVDPNHNTVIGASPLLYLIFLFLIFGLVSSLVVVILLKFRVRRSLGLYLILLYLVLIVAEWLTEFSILDFSMIFKS